VTPSSKDLRYNPSTRLDAKKIIANAKRFQDYDLGGHGLNDQRIPYGSSLNNFSILDIKKRIQNSLKESRNSVAIKSLAPLDANGSPTNISKFRSDMRGAYMKDNAYRMEFTRGHVERTIQQSHII
jgi:hypothetical protein